MTIRQSWSESGMTIGRVAPSKASPVRLTTPYLEVETQPDLLGRAHDLAGAGAGQPGHEEEAQGRLST
jgi:hypothetical protein